MSGSKEHFDMSERRSFLDLGSESGNRVPCKESNTSRTSWRGNTPLRNVSNPSQSFLLGLYLLSDEDGLEQSPTSRVTLNCSFRKEV